MPLAQRMDDGKGAHTPTNGSQTHEKLAMCRCQLQGWKGHKKRCRQEEAILKRQVRHLETRQAEFTHVMSLVEGIPLVEFWFQPPGGGPAMNSRQARAHLALAHKERRWKDLLQCTAAMAPMLGGAPCTLKPKL